MQVISIEYILRCMPNEKNYFDNIWKMCLNEDKKRYNRIKFSNTLKKMEELGHIKKHGHKSDVYYEKLHHITMEDNIGFINNMIFTYESKINKASKNLKNKKIFVDISKNLNSYKLNKFVKTDYEILLEGMSGMFELASSIIWTKEKSDDSKLKKELTDCFTQIKKFLEDANQKLLKDKKTNEIILLQRDFGNKIPKPGYLRF